MYHGKLVIRQLNQEKTDRCGDILQLSVGCRMDTFQCTQVLYKLTSILAYGYTYEENRDFTESGSCEVNECWIYMRRVHEDWTIRVNHKYWGRNRVETFVDMVLAWAKHQRIEVIDERSPTVD